MFLSTNLAYSEEFDVLESSVMMNQKNIVVVFYNGAKV